MGRIFSLFVTMLAALGAFTSLSWDVDEVVGTEPEVESRGEEIEKEQQFSMEPTVQLDESFAGEVSRRVLALYDSSELVHIAGDQYLPSSAETCRAHNFAELPLNHLGMAVDYWDVNSEEWPSELEMSRYRGVLIWFNDDTLPDPGRFFTWIGDQATKGRRVVFMERLGAMVNRDGSETPKEVYAPALAALQMVLRGNGTYEPALISVESSDPKMIGFERSLPSVLPYYQGWRAADDADVYLQLKRTDVEDSISDAVHTSERGGFVLEGYAFTEDQMGTRLVRRWLLDPFAFFSAAFGLEGMPRPDFTTRTGSRLFYAHIDGDGLEQLSELHQSTRCGDVIRQEILEKYSLPWTASVVVGFVAPPPLGIGSDAEVTIAKRILALENVEVASHGWAHPMDWRADNLDVVLSDLPEYQASAEGEIRDSVEYIDTHLTPPTKKTKVMLWTGRTNPSEEQLQIAYDLGIRNLNGGNARMDGHYPSYAHLVPPIHQVGGTFQFYTSAANEFILTDNWTSPYYRYQNVIQTFEASGGPRRMVPVNIYVHYYIGKNQAAMIGLERVMKWTMGQELAPVFASEYIDIANDFHHARIARIGDRVWQVRLGQALRTVRFDDPSMHIDVARSEGVQGYYQDTELGVTYVHLATSHATIVEADHKPSVPYLVKASHVVQDESLQSGELRWRSHGVGVKRYEFGGLPVMEEFRVIRTTGTAVEEQTVRSDDNGHLRLEFSPSVGDFGVVARRVGP